MSYQRQSISGNAVATTITNTISPTDLTITVVSLVGFPNTAVGPFVVTLERGTTNEEKIEIASYTGNILTVSQRGYDGTTAVQHTAGADLRHTLNAVLINNHEAFVAGNGTVTPTTSAVGDSASDGVSPFPAAADHKHQREPWATGRTSSSSPGDSASDGVSTSPARADHKHAREPVAVVETPVGAVVMWPTNSIPTNWLPLQGQTITGGVATWPLLAAAWPALVSGANLVMPNMEDRIVVGAGGQYGLGTNNSGGPWSTSAGGKATLTVGMIPQITVSMSNIATSGTTGTESATHDHSIADNYMVARAGNGTYTFGSGPDVNDMAQVNTPITASENVTHTHSFSTTGGTGSVNIGSATPSNAIPPYLALNYIVKAA